jgi:ATP-dependent DNA helicase RecQ
MFALRPFQTKALSALVRPGHVICVAPTGSGKSLVFERIATKGVRTLIVSPLVALSRQQGERLDRAGVRTSLNTNDQEAGAWIISPEKLHFQGSRRSLAKWRPELLVVDECHCLWEWGERFRPAFLMLPNLIHELPIARSLWLTATLPLEARLELRERIPAPISEIGSFALPKGLQLSLVRVPWPQRIDALLLWLDGHDEPGIVFVTTRESSERVTRLISSTGRSAVAYHAGMSHEERSAIENRISRNEVQVIVATSAFGMGMDHPHLRWAVLWQSPPTLLALAQAIGRVGRRDGAMARALVLWDDEDFRLLEWTARGSERRQRELLCTRVFLETQRCRTAGLLEYFERTQGLRCGICDFCLGDTGLLPAAAGTRSF